MSNNILLSIIVPTYNSEEWIKESIDCIVMQLNERVELLIVDDCSTDKTYDICKKIYIQENVLILHNDKNSGPAATRNRGIKESHGKYIWFVDSDDKVSPGSVETIIKKIDKSYADMYIFSYKEYMRSCDYPLLHLAVNNMRLILDSESEKKQILCHFLRSDFGYAIWHKIYSKRILEENDVKFSEELKLAEDIAFNLKFLYYSSIVNISDEVIYHYIRREYSITDKLKSERRLADIMMAYSTVAHLFINDNDIILTGFLYIGYKRKWDLDIYEDCRTVKEDIKLSNKESKLLFRLIKYYGKRYGILNFISYLIYDSAVKEKVHICKLLIKIGGKIPI